jgi:hypothetical protein
MSVSDSEIKAIETKLLETLLNSLNIEKQHFKFNELEHQVNLLIEQATNDVSIKNSGFKPLVERFTIDLIETMIAKPLGSIARKERFERGRADLCMLSLFSSDCNVTEPLKSNFISKVLTQKNINTKNITDKNREYKELIGTSIEKTINLSNTSSQQELLNQSKKLITPLVDLAFSKNINIEALVNKISTIKNIPTTPLDGAFFIYNAVSGYIKDSDDSQNQSDSYIDQLVSEIVEANSKEEVKQEIEIDMQNLVDLFKNAVVPAMSLELPFISAVTLFIDVVKSTIDGTEYRKFIVNNIGDIYYNEFQNIDNEKSKTEIKSKIISEMNKIIYKIEAGANNG